MSDIKGSCDIKALQDYMRNVEERSKKWEAEDKKWREVTIPKWKQDKEAEKNRLRNEWNKGLKPGSNEIVWQGRIRNCSGVASRPRKCCDAESDFVKACQCLGRSPGCGTSCVRWKNRNNCGSYSLGTASPNYNKFGSWNSYYSRRMNTIYKTEPPRPPKPIFAPFTNVCQDCRNFQLGIENTDSRDTAIKQASQCINKVTAQQSQAQAQAEAEKAAVAAKEAEAEVKGLNAGESTESQPQSTENESTQNGDTNGSANNSGSGSANDSVNRNTNDSGQISNNNLLYLGMGGSYMIFCMMIVMMAGFFFMSRRK